jgi:hypothetical protein
MNRRTKWIAAAAVAATVTAVGTHVAVASGVDDRAPRITGNALDRASAAALDYTGPGAVTGTEAGDEEGYYEVEVSLSDGSRVDVHLDRDFNVLNSRVDEEE